MWQDLLKPVEPVEKRFAIGTAYIKDNHHLRVEIVGLRLGHIDLILGDSLNQEIGINKESAKRLSAMFLEMYTQMLEE